MKKLTLKDATKEELIQYFFTCDYFGGGYRIQADKERFLIWLQQKRTGELLDAQEASIDASQKALDEYISYIKQANNEQDIEKKLDLLEKANKAYNRYVKFNKRYDYIEDKLNEAMKNE